MTHLKQNRRSLLLGAAGLALGGTALSQAAAPDAKAYVLQSSEGETVVRPSGDIVIKVDPTRARRTSRWGPSTSRSAPAFRSIATS